MKLWKLKTANQKNDLHSTLNRKFVQMTVLLLFIGVLFAVLSEYFEYQQETRNIRHDFIAFHKNILAEQVSRIIEKIETTDRNIEIEIKKNVKHNTELLKTLLLNTYEANKATLPEHKLKELLIKTIKSNQVLDPENAFFLIDFSGQCLLDNHFIKKQGTNIFYEPDALGSQWFINASMAVNMSDEVFVSSYWKHKNPSKKLADRRLMFLTRFEPYDWIVGQGQFYNDFLEREQKRLINEIAEFRFSKTGTFFLNSLQGERFIANGVICTPNLFFSEADSNNWTNFQAQKDILLHNNSGFLNTEQYGNGKQEFTRLTYVDSYMNWDWVIGATLNTNDINAIVEHKKSIALAAMRFRFFIGLLIIILMLAIASVLSRRFTHQIINHLDLFLDYFKNEKQEFIDLDKIHYVEFKSLADAINTVLAEKRQALEHSQREKSYFARLFNNIPLAIAITDQNLTIKRVNKRFKQLFEYTSNELHNEHVSIITPDDKKQEENDIYTKTQAGASVSIEATRRISKQGQIIDVSVLAMPVFPEKDYFATYLIYHNITERLQTQKELIEHQNLLRVFFNNSLEGFLIFQLQSPLSPTEIRHLDGSKTDLLAQITLLRFNKTFADSCSLTETQLNGLTINQVFPNRESFLLKKLIELFDKGSMNLASYRISPEGKLTWVDGKYICFYDNKNNLKGFFGVQNDISKRRESERKLKKAKNRAQQTDKLKTAFLSNMSHEIRTPMNTIIGFSDLLLDPNLTRAEISEFVKDINENSKTLLKLIEDIVDIAKIESNQLDVVKQPTDLDTLFTTLNKTFTLDIQKNPKKSAIKLELLIPEGQININTDPLRLQQIFWNLLNNAIKFTNTGSIWFGYQLIDCNNTKLCRFFVEDTGIGISAQYHELVFDRFVKIESHDSEQQSGQGLGLSISRKLVELLGSRLIMKSKPNSGTHFSFDIELHGKTERKTATPVPLAPLNTPPTNKQTLDWSDKYIVVAEDNQINYRLIQKILAHTNINLIHARNGLEVLEIAKDNRKIDLFLMDIQMPRMDGITCTKEIRTLGLSQAIIAQTAYTMDNEHQKLLEAGFTEIVNKPINAAELINTLAKHIA